MKNVERCSPLSRIFAGRLCRSSGPIGYTLIELVIVSAILAILAIPLARFIRTTLHGLTSFTGQALARGEVLPAFHAIEYELRNAVYVNDAPISGPTAFCDGNSIEIYMDASRMPGHTCNPPDDDGDDAPVIDFKIGMNVEDMDEDPPSAPDGKIDVKCRIYQNGSDVFIAHSWNEGPWIPNRVLRGVPPGGLQFRYFGSISEPSGETLDKNGDGLVSGAELGFNSSGTSYWGTPITGIEVLLGQDRTGRCGTIVTDADFRKTKFWIKARVSPILLPIRARAKL